MKVFKIEDSKIIICLLVIVCMLAGWLIFRSYQMHSENNKVELGKNIIFSRVYTDDDGNVASSQMRIFKLDSEEKCMSCKVVLNQDIETLKKIALEIASDITLQYSNIKLQDCILYFDDNQYNGLTQEDIKNKVYTDFEEVGLNNMKYKVYTSFSEI